MRNGERPPLVTVIVPVKDPHLGFLAEALDSVRAQSVPWWRLLIVAEAPDLAPLSRDISRWLEDPRTRLIANQGSSHAGAINTAMRAAESQFVALLLGDDLWHADAVAVLEDHITRYPKADFFHSARRIVDDSGRAISSIHPARSSVNVTAFHQGSPVKHLLCWRRSLGLRVGGLDERLHIGPDDFDFPWTMAEHGAVFCPIGECLYIYRDHRSARRLTTHVPLTVQVRELRLMMRKHGMSRQEINTRIRDLRMQHLRQCLYRGRLQKLLSESLRMRPAAWRESYR
jgi:glycosyltransferase involved in cell wall biosynthesis